MADEKKTITEEEIRAMADKIAEELDLEGDDYGLDETEESANQPEYIVELDIENLNDAKFDAENFQRGLDDISEVCGQICGLTNVGVSVTDAFTYIINQQTIAANFATQKIINQNNVEVAKVQAARVQEQTL